MGTFEFDAATALSGEGPVFGAVLDGQWDGQASTNGGFLLALATRAIGAVLPFPDPVVVSGFYLRPGSPGPAELRTEVLQAGRTTGFGQAGLYRDGKQVLRATAAFTDLDAAAARDGRSYAGGQLPDPAPGWVAFRTQTRYLADGYFEEDAELWDGTGRLVAQSRQLALVLG